LSGPERIFNAEKLNFPRGFAATRFFNPLKRSKTQGHLIAQPQRGVRDMAENGSQNGGNGPEFIAYHVPDRRNAPWVRIGAAWSHKRGVGYSVRIEMIPLDLLRTGELVIQLRQPEAKGGQAPEQE
jgi:hypothetical protein